MAKIQISENESLREAIRRFKKMCDKEGIINQSKRYAYLKNRLINVDVKLAGELKT